MNSAALLTQLGLDDKEVAIYLAALELGMAPVSVIAKRANLKRPTAHEVLKKLCSKKLVDRFIKNRIRYYSAVSPKLLYDQYQHLLLEFQGLLPNLLALHSTDISKPKISFYEGRKDVERLYLDVLQCQSGEALNYFRPGKVFDYFSKEWGDMNHIATRVAKNIRLRVIMTDGWWVEEYKEKSPRELRTFKVITDPSLELDNEVYIYDDKINIFSFDQDFALQIKSNDVVKTQKSMFELAWHSSLLRDP